MLNLSTKIKKAPALPSLYFFKAGEIVEGSVLEQKQKKLFLDLKIATGIVYGAEYLQAAHIVKGLKLGDIVKAKVVDSLNDDGYVELSLFEVEEELKWDSLEKQMKSGEAIIGKVIGVNRGGLLLSISSTKAFLPASQLSQSHYPYMKNADQQKIIEELRKLVGQELKVKIITLDPKEAKLVVSEKAAEEEALKSAVSNYKIGDIIDGEISDVMPFGAFIKFGDAAPCEGLIHISEISHSLINNPREIISSGQKVKAKIVNIDEHHRIALSLKALEDDPWIFAATNYFGGQEVDGEVFDLKDYGAFVKLDGRIHGLCHISDFENNAQLMKQELKAGDKKKFKVEFINAPERKLSLKLVRA